MGSSGFASGLAFGGFAGEVGGLRWDPDLSQRVVGLNPQGWERDVARHRNIANPRVGSFWGLTLVVAVRVEGELSEEFSGGGVDDADVEVLDDHEDLGVGVFAAEVLLSKCPFLGV